MKRDDWMLGPPQGEDKDPLSGLFSSASRGEAGNKRKPTSTPTISSRELNPHFKDGGTGLPPGAPLFTRTDQLTSSRGFIKPPHEDEASLEAKAGPRSDGERDLNKVQARRLKAELMGDTKLVQDLDSHLRHLERQERALMSQEPSSVSRKDSGLTRMAREERRLDGNSMDRQLAESICRQSKFQTFEEFSQDYGSARGGRRSMTSFTPSSSHGRGGRDEGYVCSLCACVEGESDPSVVAIGEYTYLRLPSRNSLGLLHCQIVPLQHASSYRDVDDPEDGIWTELRNFKKCLLSLAASIERTVVFLETATLASRQRCHAIVDAVFLPRTLRLDPKTFYSRALREEGGLEEAKIIDTSAKGLRKSIPRGFPYAYVDFRLDQGLARVLDENGSQSRGDYLIELTADLFGLERHEWRHSHKVAPEVSAKFRKLYEPFDWTKLLHES